jgi:hypothetical protein
MTVQFGARLSMRGIFAAPLLCVTVFLATANTASAQLYVAQYGFATVSEYNSTDPTASAPPINVSLITGLSLPGGLVLSGNTLFVANSGANKVGKYTVNGATATEANPNFINTGLSTPIAIAVSGSHLFVVNANGNQTISEYDANTGTLQKASVLPPSTTQVGDPVAIAVSNNYLFVAHYQEATFLANNYGLGSVGQYDLSSGAVVEERLIKGLAGPISLAVDGSTLFVLTSGYTAASAGGVGTYNATSGAPIKANLVTGLTKPDGIAILGNTVFVAVVDSGLGWVATYDAATGATLDANFITGLRSPYGLAVAPATATPPPSQAPPRISFHDPIAKKWVDVTAKTQSVVAGEQILLKASPAYPAPPLDLSWGAIDPKADPAPVVGRYATPDLGGPIQQNSATLTPAVFTNPATASFYFVSPGVYTVLYHYISDGTSHSVTVTFDVDGPTNPEVTTDPSPGRTAVILNKDSPSAEVELEVPPLVPGSPKSPGPGIDFRYTANSPSKYSGNFFWTQLLETQGSSVVSGKSTVVSNGNQETFWLDNAFPYPAEATSFFHGCYNSATADNPWAKMNATVSEYHETLFLRMYLMWQCTDIPGTIPVSLGYIPWRFDINIKWENGEWVQIKGELLQGGTTSAFQPLDSIIDSMGDSETTLNTAFPIWPKVAFNIPANPEDKLTPCGPP